MNRPSSRLVLVLLSLLVALLTSGALGVSAQATTVPGDVPQISLDNLNVRDLKIDMGEGWTADAEFTWPKEGTGPFPTVILFHGGCSCGGMDGAYWENPGDPLQMRNFRLLASELGKQGIAVMRFARRGAIGDRESDAAQEGEFFSDPLRAAADGEAVLSVTKTQAEADPARTFLYGWSYGGLIVSMIAPYHPELKGVILQGTGGDVSSLAQTSHLSLEVVTPYLTRAADKNQDGKLSPEELYELGVRQGPVWWITGGLFDPASTPAKPVFASGLDTNQDGLLDIQAELIPYLTTQAQGSVGAGPFGKAFSPAQTFGQIKMPILILEGESDGLISQAEYQELVQAAGSYATLKTYPGLGHALSKISEPALDIFGPMEQQPINDAAAWILAQK